MLIFQYGSNCLDRELNGEARLQGDAAFDGIAKADGFELSFDVWGQNRGCAAANIVRRDGATVWGALYNVPDYLITRESAQPLGRKSLDQIEGQGKNYDRQFILVQRPSGEFVQATTYTVIVPLPDLKTATFYVQHIIEGLRQRGIDAAYIDRVKAIATANNPVIAHEIAAL